MNTKTTVERKSDREVVVTTVTFEEKSGRTLVVLRETYPSKEALETSGGAVDAMGETFDQLDELLSTL